MGDDVPPPITKAAPFSFLVRGKQGPEPAAPSDKTSLMAGGEAGAISNKLSPGKCGVYTKGDGQLALCVESVLQYGTDVVQVSKEGGGSLVSQPRPPIPRGGVVPSVGFLMLVHLLQPRGSHPLSVPDPKPVSL
jgi:hypothetical protein